MSKKNKRLFKRLFGSGSSRDSGGDQTALAQAKAFAKNADAEYNRREYEKAVELYAPAIYEYEHIRGTQRDVEATKQLASAYVNKAGCLRWTDDLEGALNHYDRAIELYERLENTDGKREYAKDWAAVYYGKYFATNALGNVVKAAEFLGKAQEIQQRFGIVG